MATTVQMTLRFHTAAEADRVRNAAARSGVMPTVYYRAQALRAVGEVERAEELLGSALPPKEDDKRFADERRLGTTVITFRQPVEERALVVRGIERTGLQQQDWARLVFLSGAGDTKSGDETRLRLIELSRQLRRVRMARPRK